MRRWISCLFLLGPFSPTLIAQAAAPAPFWRGCAAPKVRVTSEELRNRITHREPLRLYETNVRIASDSVVRLELAIAAKGTVDCASVIEGHPLLYSAALESVRHWRFRPLLAAGKAVSYGGVLVLKGEDFK